MPAGPRPGWFGSADVGLLFPRVTNGLTAPVLLPRVGIVDTVNLPSAGLDVTVAPSFTVGYRLKDNLGSILLSYHNLTSEGRELILNFDAFGDAQLRSRLDVNTVTLSYAASEHPLGALWAIKWEVGARLGTIFFDSQAQGLLVGQRSSDHFIGAGPMVALDLTRELPAAGLALYSRVEAAELLGHIQQRFAESVGDPAAPFDFGSFEPGGSQGVPMLGIQAGLSWLSRPDGRYRLTAGYQFEHYWGVGKVGDSHGDVLAQGLFLRGEFNY
jgi:hypothetical protein